jgi:hypothetical protein
MRRRIVLGATSVQITTEEFDEHGLYSGERKEIEPQSNIHSSLSSGNSEKKPSCNRCQLLRAGS